MCAVACILGGKVGRQSDTSCQFTFQQNESTLWQKQTTCMQMEVLILSSKYKYRQQIMQKSDDKLVVS